MRIEKIRSDYYRIPLPVALSDSTHGTMTHFELVIVRLECDSGHEGLGYTYTVGSGGAAIQSLIERDLAPLLEGADPRRIEELWERMWWRLHYVGRGGLTSFAISACDIALWDLRGVQAGEPWWRLLGGSRDRVPAYAGGIDLFFSIDELCAQAEGFLAKGFRAIKSKVGRERLAEDVTRIAAVRETIGPDMPLMVDANMRWSVEQAIRAARALAPYDITWLEEPTIPDDIAGHARIAREGGLPLATGENLHTLYEFRHMIAYGAIAFPEPDVANIGGVTAWLKVAHLAQAHNLPVTSHGVHDLHVHLLAAVPNASYLEAHGFGLEAFIEAPLRIEEGMALAPNRPGHGVAFDWAALEPHRVKG
ncbi:MAG: mandelate racemase/muconate lactonizing enzyme family protein [Chloroflexi bacterium]|nr:mandelate racemase/muconate lactonizing enzyme family protein [Chloroflexota bacterium]